jgi:xanthine dehydrogenase accessory factor
LSTQPHNFQVVVRGGGDLASGVILRLARIGVRVIVTELPQPLAVRRLVSFAQAVYDQTIEIEGIKAQLAKCREDLPALFAQGIVPVIIDPDGVILDQLQPQVLIDARMTKRPPELAAYPAKWFTVGLGPGFTVGQNCDVAIETNRGRFLGRVYWSGSPEPDTGQPEIVANHGSERVLRAPQDGILHTLVTIGDHLLAGTPIASVGVDLRVDPERLRVDPEPARVDSGRTRRCAPTLIYAQFEGVVRGLLNDGTQVTQSMKIGDLDPRCDPSLCTLVSDKALSIGGGVLEAILSIPNLREQIWTNPSA